MTQPDLFAANAQSEPLGYRPEPARVRARLERILGQVRQADALPWERAQVSLYRTVVPEMTRWLPDEEGARWRTEFEAEMRRLGAVA